MCHCTLHFLVSIFQPYVEIGLSLSSFFIVCWSFPRDFKITEITIACFDAFLHSKTDTHYACFEIFHKVLKQELFNGGYKFVYNSVKQTFDREKWTAHERLLTDRLSGFICWLHWRRIFSKPWIIKQIIYLSDAIRKQKKTTKPFDIWQKLLITIWHGSPGQMHKSSTRLNFIKTQQNTDLLALLRAKFFES